MTERDFAITVVRTLQDAGHIAYFAGGCVRDAILGFIPVDYDVATDATPQRVQQLFKRTISVGAAFGVIEVIGPRIDGEHANVQVATFRSDGTYTDGRRPDSVTFGTPQDDAARRDFTFNGLFEDPITQTIHDFVGGREDLNKRILRAIGKPEERFEEDKLRVLRAVRMAARFDCTIDPATYAAAKVAVPGISAVSAERIADELRKILAHPARAMGFRLAQELGLIHTLFPEINPEGTESRLSSLPRNASFCLAFAVILRGSGKLARKICLRLRLSNLETDRVCWLVENQSTLKNAISLTPSQSYPTLANDGIAELLALMATDAELLKDVQTCEQVLNTTPMDILNPAPLITGDDLIKAGMKPGPQFKRILEAVRRDQLDGVLKSHTEAMANAMSSSRG